VLPWENADLERLTVEPPGCLVLHRVGWNEDMSRLIATLTANRVPVVFDTDDLIFDPDLAQDVPISARQDNGLERQRRSMTEAQGLTVSTEALARHAAAANAHAAVLPNVVSAQMVAQADRVLEQVVSGRQQSVAIGYLSGTPYHDRNFLQASDAILWALETYPDLRFIAAGHLALDSRFDGFGERVQRIPMMPWEQLPELIGTLAVNIAPLDPASPFSECKSCVKYLEAALLGVPTVASPRPDFARVIGDGKNGLLADSLHEWKEALRNLVENPRFRAELGKRAFEDVRERHTSARTARTARETLARLLDARPPRRLRIEWVVDDAPGDVRETLAAALAERGHDVTLRIAAERARPADPVRYGLGLLGIQPGSAPVERVDVSVNEGVQSVRDTADARFVCAYVRHGLTDALPASVLPIFASAEDAAACERRGRPAELAENAAALERVLLETTILSGRALGAVSPTPSRPGQLRIT
jgi:glycosyltransferase involved in cell wall biosynthesis